MNGEYTLENQKRRGFEVVSKYINDGITLPKRATSHSAGYDFCASSDICVPSILKQISENPKEVEQKESSSMLRSTLVPTGIKAYMSSDEYLLLANRSSNPMKNQLALPNGVGVVDADYYGNVDNEGEIYFQFINYGLEDYVIRKGDRIGQGIFMPFLKVDMEESPTQSRTGGFGSSGR